MKRSFLGSFIGISIILSIDSISRVIISLYNTQDIFMFSYTEYTGFWPILLVAIAAFSTFFGAMFALTYGRQKQIFTVTLFTILAGLFRYGQLLLLDDTEGLLYPVLALVLSIFSILLAWRLVRPARSKKDTSDDEEKIAQESPKKDHHYPVDGDSQRNQPQ